MYISAIGTVGHIHIGLYTRTLLMFLLDPRTKPTPKDMKRWIDFTRWYKERAPNKAFDFFTYSEMMLWILECMLLKPQRWTWMIFVLFEWGKAGKERVEVNGA